MLQTHHIHLQGQVQGVGFRPFLYRLAQELGIHGTVSNGNDGVHLEVTITEEQLAKLKKLIHQQLPERAVVTKISFNIVPFKEYQDFRITGTAFNESLSGNPTADFGMCPSCRDELFTPGHRRHLYPFITCTDCGVRYSILTRMPFEREHTVMASKPMCKACLAEYHDPLNRRFYAQTNSCPDCGYQLKWIAADNSETNHPLSESIHWLKNGKIIAVKGVGGYLLLCDATQAEVVQTLRNRKHRPTKPFALLLQDMEAIKNRFHIHHLESNFLESPASPIVLLAPKNETDIASHVVAPGLSHLGVMLPYAPLLALLAQGVNRPLIATSANISGSPILFQEEDIQQFLGTIADAILSHDRPILIPQDDSLLQFTSTTENPIILRRSRGFAPNYWHQEPQTQSPRLLALGAEQKATFAYKTEDQIFISQYLGNQNSWHTQQRYVECLDKSVDWANTSFSKILTDLHPDYFTTKLGYRICKEHLSQHQQIQHHEAHLAAVLSENNAWNQKVMGIIWDGTGYGHDGNIWGGEFFLYQNFSIQRIAHVDYFPVLGNDAMAIQPKLAAVSVFSQSETLLRHIKPQFSETNWKNSLVLAQRSGQIQNSSMGRIFDAVAALLGIESINSFEGETAMLLQEAATSYFISNGWDALDTYYHELLPLFEKPAQQHCQRLQFIGFLEQLMATSKQNTDIEINAAKFHIYLVKAIEYMAQKTNTSTLAFSGGVFQNALLIDLLYRYLKPNYQLLFHKQLPPNDENISFGQLMHVTHKIQSLNNTLCV